MKKTIAKQILHLQLVEDPTPEQVDIPEGSVALEGDPMLEQFLKDCSLCEAPTLEQVKCVRRKEQQIGTAVD
ncbi:hypothetical protein AV530_016926 [Patagioenas fasciata monilis]|uniref:Uncharacterized protein n=1 Tax=Patagioenas fasciata monilis TaxID=372326 RepID=A0A1V4J493_PATFA|nr:hypothetical protein AV530_016926 [Patagioenas fasciata monilis]